MVRKLTVADLFCGTGGFSKGFEQTGHFSVRFGIDIKKASTETFAANHKSAAVVCADIRSTRVRDVGRQMSLGPGELDVIVAGPPCQGFSSIRPYRSLNENDARNNLFEQMTVYVAYFKPRFVVFENVVGLLHHNRGVTIRQITEAIEALGYSTSTGVLNAVHFGVPQKRERVFILARRGPKAPRLPRPTHFHNGRSMAGAYASTTMPLFDRELPSAITVDEAIGDLPPVAAGEGATEYGNPATISTYARARRNGTSVLMLHEATRHTEKMLRIIRQAGANRWALPDGLTTSGFSSSYSRLAGDEPSVTVTVNFVHPASNRCIHPHQDRALTPREGARIQSFDDDFVFCGTRTQIVKQIGEAVPPLLGRAVAHAVLEQW